MESDREQKTEKPEETEIQKAQRLVKEKKEAEEHPGNIIEMPNSEFQAKIAQAQQKQQEQANHARLSRLLDGKEIPKNEMVGYLVDRLRDGRDEFQLLQANIQEVSNRLKELQIRLLQLQGEQNNRAEDIAAWWDRDMKTKAEELAIESEDPAKGGEES